MGIIAWTFGQLSRPIILEIWLGNRNPALWGLENRLVLQSHLGLNIESTMPSNLSEPAPISEVLVIACLSPPGVGCCRWIRGETFRGRPAQNNPPSFRQLICNPRTSHQTNLQASEKTEQIENKFQRQNNYNFAILSLNVFELTGLDFPKASGSHELLHFSINGEH